MSDEERVERCETPELEWCKTCRFYHGIKGFHYGSDRWICRRFPIAVDKEEVDWCGEWKPIGPGMGHKGNEAEIAESQQTIQLEREESHRRWQTIQQLEARIEEIQHEGRRWEQ